MLRLKFWQDGKVMWEIHSEAQSHAKEVTHFHVTILGQEPFLFIFPYHLEKFLFIYS